MTTESAPPADRLRRILVVDDDDSRRELFAKVLSHEGYEVDTLPDGARLVEHMRDRPPDLVLLDIMLPSISGFELCGDLRMHEETRLTPVILVTSAFPDEQSVVRGLLSGADDYVVTPSRLDELRARVRVQLRNRRDRELLQWARAQSLSFKTAAMSDSLTGLANRRAADAMLDRALANGERVLVVLLDIDHFKRINDGFGHATGDRVIREVARAMLATTRSGDTAARYGGEEFLVIVRGAALEAATAIGERYRRVVQNMASASSMPDGKGEADALSRVTVSIGIAGTAGDAIVPRSALLSAADEALYAAKREGRDRVVVRMTPVTAPLQGGLGGEDLPPEPEP